jgi:hypothetical protein
MISGACPQDGRLAQTIELINLIAVDKTGLVLRWAS